MDHGWLVKGRMTGWKISSPHPLLHKCVKEKENTRKVSLHEPAVSMDSFPRSAVAKACLAG
jgi:hypothetical protein